MIDPVSAMSIIGNIVAGVGARRSANYQAAQMRYSAGQQQAAAQRGAYDADMQAKYVASAALAAAAASGGGASDPTVMSLIAHNASEMAYRKAVALYEGDDRARSLNVQADATKYEGKLRMINSFIGAGAAAYKSNGSLLDGASSMLSKYGGRGPTLPEAKNESNWYD